VRLRVFAVGKLKDPALEQLCDRYVRRSRCLLPIEREPCRDLGSLRAKLQTCKGPQVVLDERGEQLGSIELSRWLQLLRDSGTKDISFAIGGAEGFAQSDRDGATRILALSRLTLPHRLAQVILCEQLYRAGTILFGHPYHND
jgi:23S rRNA (pseudouridine1915-N3)-methyltransferase